MLGEAAVAAAAVEGVVVVVVVVVVVRETMCVTDLWGCGREGDDNEFVLPPGYE